MTQAENRRYAEYLQTEKWKQISRKRLMIDNWTCQMCGCRGTATNPLDIHHLDYKSIFNEENKIFESLVCLCRCCHKGVHYMMQRVTSPGGRRGWRDAIYVPQIHVFSLDGMERQRKEDEICLM